ncbi:MAG: hypothetical protein SGPRY_003498 [Prymnesium sp.]
MGSGIIESFALTSPTDRVKVLKQVASTQQCSTKVSFLSVVRDHGFLALYRGALATTLRQASSVAIRFFCFEEIKTALCTTLRYDGERTPAWILFLAGGISGAVSVALNNPIDVVKSQIQAGNHSTIAESLCDTIRKRGISGLLAGLSVRIPRVFLSQAIQFTCVDVFKRSLKAFACDRIDEGIVRSE